MKLAVETGVIAVNPMVSARPPRAQRSIPKHWTPEQAREFLGLMEGDRTYPAWASLLGSGLRIGELVSLRWANVDLGRRVVHVAEFVSTLGYRLEQSPGKSRDAVRSIDLDDGLVRVLRAQRKLHAEERLAAKEYVDGDYVFTRATGGPSPIPATRRTSDWARNDGRCEGTTDRGALGRRPPGVRAGHRDRRPASRADSARPLAR